MEKLELRFTYEKETRNTVRYQEQLDEVAIPDSRQAKVSHNQAVAFPAVCVFATRR